MGAGLNLHLVHLLKEQDGLVNRVIGRRVRNLAELLVKRQGFLGLAQILFVQLSGADQDLGVVVAQLEAEVTGAVTGGETVLPGADVSPGEGLAVQYITAEFTKAGLSPKGEKGYVQPFVIDDGKAVKHVQ